MAELELKSTDRWNAADAVGLNSDEMSIWPETHKELERLRFVIKHAPGKTTSTLGQGQYALVVYATQVSHDGTEFPVAIKIFLHRDDEVFSNEVKTLNLKDFPKEFGPAYRSHSCKDETQPFIVMDYIRGTPIDEYVTVRSLSTAKQVELMEKLLTGLGRFHDIHWAHRDVHAKNVAVTEDGKVRLLDYGMAGPHIERHDTISTRGNVPCSPKEVQEGWKRATSQDDLYNVAALTTQILTGSAIPQGISGNPKHLKHCRDQLRSANVPTSLIDVIVKGLQAEDHRYTTAKEFAAKLEDWRTHRPKRWRLFWRIIVALVAGGLLASLLVAWSLSRSAAHDESIKDKLNDRKLKLGVALTSIPFELDSPIILAKKRDVETRYSQLSGLIGEGRVEEAERAVDEIQSELAILIQQYAVAMRAHKSRTTYSSIVNSLPPGLRQVDGFKKCNELATAATTSWTEGEFQEAARLFGLANDGLIDLREAHETGDDSAKRVGPDRNGNDNEALLHHTDRRRENASIELANVEKTLNSIEIEFVKLLPNKFQMGSSSPFSDNEHKHEVELTKAVWFGVTEVTEGQYRQGRHIALTNSGDRDRLPVGNVTWYDAVDWCNALSDREKRARMYRVESIIRHDGSIISADVTFLSPVDNPGYRLPTEAEWEYAARAGTPADWKWYFGDDEEKLVLHAWFRKNSDGNRRAVGTKQPNKWHLRDMAGGQLEWCNDLYKHYYYFDAPVKDPLGPQSPDSQFGNVRVVRGGSFMSTPNETRSACRDCRVPGYFSPTTGFRVVRPARGSQ